MIRYVFIAAMLAILCIVLYIPSAVPPERFLDVLREEHEVTKRTWGPEIADRVLARMLDMQQASAAVSAAPTRVETGQPTAVDAAMTAQVGHMSTRLFGNPYFRSIDSLFALVSYRLSAALELLPLLGIFLVIVAVDGFVVRMVRSKEFIAHSAELFGGSLVGGIALGSAVVIAWFLPYPLHPMLVVLTLLGMLFVLSRAVANYHVMR